MFATVLPTRLALALVAPLALVAATASAAHAPSAASSFVAAPPGIGVTSTSVALPSVAVPVGPIVQSGRIGGAFGPTLQELLEGEVVVETQAEMKLVWRVLFGTPYDPTLFDFANDAVVLMGGGAMVLGSFDISAVERVDAEWSSFGFGPGTEVDAFLAVTATTVFPGILPINPPPPTWRVSAVRVAKSDLDDVVFHRTSIFAP
ncbi:MAG: hypothetical protein R3F34_13855 [Planctomycetota bacterium]